MALPPRRLLGLAMNAMFDARYSGPRFSDECDERKDA